MRVSIASLTKGFACIAMLMCAVAHAAPSMVPLGVHRSNLAWAFEGSLDSQKELVDIMYNANIRRLRFSYRPNEELSIAHIKYAREKGMHVHLVIPTAFAAFFEPGTEKRPGTDIFRTVYPVSKLDTTRFHVEMVRILGAIKSSGTRPDALELFNETNWAGFNGDLPVIEGGYIFDASTPISHEHLGTVVEGTLRYGQAARITRHVLDSVFGSDGVPLVSSGFVYTDVQWMNSVDGSMIDPGFWFSVMAGQSPSTQSKTDYTRFFQQIGVHAYPGMESAATVNELVNDCERRTQPVREVLGDDFAFNMTEWGFNEWLFRNEANPGLARLKTHQLFMDALNRHAADGTSWVDAYLFSFDQKEGFMLYQDNTLTPTATLFEQYSWTPRVGTTQPVPLPRNTRAGREGAGIGSRTFLLNGMLVPGQRAGTEYRTTARMYYEIDR